ncbi:hypothetical protein D3C72_1790370 [compost metagenome]
MRWSCRLQAARRLAPWMIARQLTGTQYGRGSCSSSATSSEMPTNTPMITESYTTKSNVGLGSSGAGGGGATRVMCKEYAKATRHATRQPSATMPTRRGTSSSRPGVYAAMAVAMMKNRLPGGPSR